jgi:hypothetical protein
VARPRNKNGAITIVDPDGVNIKIPSWMVEPQAENHSLSDYAAIDPQALLFLSDLLQVLMKDKDMAL